METNENRKRKGWHNERIRHSLARKGIKTANLKSKQDRARDIAEEGELTWEKFQELYPEDAEKELQRLFDEDLIELDADEADTAYRKRLRETRITFDDDGEEKQLEIVPDTEITFLQKTE